MVMMRNILAIIVLLSLITPITAMAQPSVLAVNLAEDHVDITTGFNGAHLVLFGTKGKKGDIAVVLRGPKRDAVVRRKSNIFGAWVNKSWIRFKDVPELYKVALSGKEQDLLPPDILKEEKIGLTSLRFDPAREGIDADKLKLFQDALIRNRQADGLFPTEPSKVKMINDQFFKVEFYITANVPTGDYVIETYLIENQKIVDKELLNLRIAQIGFGAMIYKFAHSYYFSYAILTLLIAAFAGWLSNAVRLKT